MDDKRFGWQVSEGIANLRLRCLELALANPTMPFGAVHKSERPDPIVLAKRISDFVIDGTVAIEEPKP